MRMTWTVVILAGGLLVGLFALDLPGDIYTWSVRIIQIVFALQVGFWGTGMISLYVERRVDSKIQEDNAEDATTLDALGLIVKIALWSVLALIILDNVIQNDLLLFSLDNFRFLSKIGLLY